MEPQDVPGEGIDRLYVPVRAHFFPPRTPRAEFATNNATAHHSDISNLAASHRIDQSVARPQSRTACPLPLYYRCTVFFPHGSAFTEASRGPRWPCFSHGRTTGTAGKSEESRSPQLSRRRWCLYGRRKGARWSADCSTRTCKCRRVGLGESIKKPN